MYRPAHNSYLGMGLHPKLVRVYAPRGMYRYHGSPMEATLLISPTKGHFNRGREEFILMAIKAKQDRNE